MKRIGFIVFLGVTGIAVHAQNPGAKMGILPVSRWELRHSVPAEIHTGPSLFMRMQSPPVTSPLRTALPERMPFFCRMERRGVDRTGIWFKIHAGDYEAYSHRK